MTETNAGHTGSSSIPDDRAIVWISDRGSDIACSWPAQRSDGQSVSDLTSRLLFEDGSGDYDTYRDGDRSYWVQSLYGVATMQMDEGDLDPLIGHMILTEFDADPFGAYHWSCLPEEPEATVAARAEGFLARVKSFLN